MQLRIDGRTGTGAGAILPMRGEGLVFERGGRRILDGIDIEISGRLETTAETLSIPSGRSSSTSWRASPRTMRSCGKRRRSIL